MPALSSGEDFHQLKLRFTDPIQSDYEEIRPIVLYAERVTDRSEQTGVARTTLGEKARRFVQHGMLGLVDQRPAHAGRKGHSYPPPVANYILYLKQRYPPIHDREIVRILERRFGYKTNHHTVRHFLVQHPTPIQLELWELDDEQWRKIVERPLRPRAGKQRREVVMEQLPLMGVGLLMLMLAYIGVWQ